MGCKCCKSEHCEEIEEKETIYSKEKILYIVSIILFAISFIPIINKYQAVFCLISIILSGYELITEGIKNIFKLNFEEDTLMTIAIIAAFLIGEFPESCMVVLLFKLGEFIEEKTLEKSEKRIKHIVDIKAQNANLILEKEQIKVVDVKELQVGDAILIKPGEMVPVDVIITKGKSEINKANITGESILIDVKENDELISGSINQEGALEARVVNDFENSAATKIVDLVYEAKNNKGKTEEFITKFSKVYTPIVMIIAILIVAISLIVKADIKIWGMRALVFLVASCPCSIIISIPLAFFSCVGTISKKGMLIKGTKHIENLSKTKIICFDKTGTLTTGNMEIENIQELNGYKREEILSYICSLEKNSNHPISNAIKKISDNVIIKKVKNSKEIAGKGLYGEIDGKEILFGNVKLLKEYNVKLEKTQNVNGNFLCVDKEIIAIITWKEEIRKDSLETIKMLTKIGIKKVVMLTGDHKENADKIAKTLGITKVYSELLPDEKLTKVAELKKDGKVAFIGDGINDSPVLAEANFGISMGNASEITTDTADSILISNELSKIPTSIKIAKKTMRIIKFNIIFSLIVKAVVMILGFLGKSPIWLAILADMGVTLITVFNSVRISIKK